MKTHLAVTLAALIANAGAATILLVDDSRGLPVQDAWTETLGNLGHSVTVEVIDHNSNVTSDLSSYDLVIWTVGDHAYDNLSTDNWTSMTDYVSSGGKLIYAGGHSVYQENNVGHAAIETFFGVSSTAGNMPMWNSSTTVTGTGNSPSFGTTTYDLQIWSGGEYDNMASAFDVSTATGLVNQPASNSGSAGPFVVAHNPTNGTQLWGIDLNQIAPDDREAFMAASLSSHAIPEPSSAALCFGAALAVFRRRRGA